jgi:hypothetical protein
MTTGLQGTVALVSDVQRLLTLLRGVVESNLSGLLSGSMRAETIAMIHGGGSQSRKLRGQKSSIGVCLLLGQEDSSVRQIEQSRRESHQNLAVMQFAHGLLRIPAEIQHQRPVECESRACLI